MHVTCEFIGGETLHGWLVETTEQNNFVLLGNLTNHKLVSPRSEADPCEFLKQVALGRR